MSEKELMVRECGQTGLVAQADDANQGLARRIAWAAPLAKGIGL